MIETLIPVPGRLKPFQSGVLLAYVSDIYDDVYERKLSLTLLSINGVIPIIPAYEYRIGLYRPTINGKLADDYDPASPDFEESEINGNNINYYNTVFVVPAININDNPDWNNVTYYIYDGGWKEKTSFERGKIYINIDTYKLYTGGTQNQLVLTCVTAEDLLYSFNLLYSYCENLDNRLQALEGDETSSISWSGGSINPSTISVSGTATLTKGTVLAHYTSGRTENVTDVSVFRAATGTIEGNIYYPNQNQVGLDIISVVYNNVVSRDTLSINVEKKATNIQWSSSSATATIGSSNTFPTLQNVEQGMFIAYRTSNESVADIDSEGNITLVGEGTCIVTASFAEDATRLGSISTYTLTVEQAVVTQYTVSLNVIHGSKTPNTSFTVNEGGNASWVIEPDEGYQLPIGVAGASLVDNIVNVTNITANREYVAECEPIESHLSVQVGHGTNYSNAVFTDTERQLSSNMRISINKNDGDYLFIKVDENDTVNNLYVADSPIVQNLSLESPVSVSGGYKYYRTTYQYRAGSVDYIINQI